MPPSLVPRRSYGNDVCHTVADNTTPTRHRGGLLKVLRWLLKVLRWAIEGAAVDRQDVLKTHREAVRQDRRVI